MNLNLSPVTCGPDWWLPVDPEASAAVDLDTNKQLHCHASNLEGRRVTGAAVYGLAKEVLVRGQGTGFFVMRTTEPPAPIPVHVLRWAEHLRAAASIEVFGHELVRINGILQPSPAPRDDLVVALRDPHPCGGGVVDVEPDADPAFQLDYEALGEYQPTAQSIAEDLDALNQEHALGIDGLVDLARKEALGDDAPFAGTWEAELIRRLTAQGFLVYASETRLRAYRFSPLVHGYVRRQATPGAKPGAELFDAGHLHDLVDADGIANALAMVHPDQIQDAALAEAWLQADLRLGDVERLLVP